MTTELAPVNLARTYTSAEFEELPDAGQHYELIRGKLSKMPPTGDEHGRIGKKLLKWLLFHDPEEKLGQVWFTTGFVLDKDNTLEPDLMFVAASRVPKLSKKALDIIPDLVVEVWSPSDLRSQKERDNALAKIKIYQNAGVKLIWSIFPDNQTVQVYEGKAGPKTLSATDTLGGGEIIPGFNIKISELFSV